MSCGSFVLGEAVEGSPVVGAGVSYSFEAFATFARCIKNVEVQVMFRCVGQGDCRTEFASSLHSVVDRLCKVRITGAK